ncbi:hypothetical protein AHAS_Ahas02G0214800 [Arachis hypogaea]
MEEKGGVLMQRYELGRLLGQGNFAKVYHGRSLITGISVAIKIVDKEKVLKVGMIDQIKREISVMRLIRHPHVVELYEVMATKTKIYFIMEYVKGGELFNKPSHSTEESSEESSDVLYHALYNKHQMDLSTHHHCQYECISTSSQFLFQQKLEIA